MTARWARSPHESGIDDGPGSVDDGGLVRVALCAVAGEDGESVGLAMLRVAHDEAERAEAALGPHATGVHRPVYQLPAVLPEVLEPLASPQPCALGGGEGLKTSPLIAPGLMDVNATGVEDVILGGECQDLVGGHVGGEARSGDQTVEAVEATGPVGCQHGGGGLPPCLGVGLSGGGEVGGHGLPG